MRIDRQNCTANLYYWRDTGLKDLSIAPAAAKPAAAAATRTEHGYGTVGSVALAVAGLDLEVVLGVRVQRPDLGGRLVAHHAYKGLNNEYMFL